MIAKCTELVLGVVETFVQVSGLHAVAKNSNSHYPSLTSPIWSGSPGIRLGRRDSNPWTDLRFEGSIQAGVPQRGVEYTGVEQAGFNPLNILSRVEVMHTRLFQNVISLYLLLRIVLHVFLWIILELSLLTI